MYICGSVISIHNLTNLTLKENVAEEGGAMYVSKAKVTLGGNVTIESNTANMGGGIRAVECFIQVVGNCDLAWNNASYGGAMNTLHGKVSFQGPTQFTHNTADEDGGAICADGTVVQIQQRVNFDFNSAKNGGALSFKNGARLKFTYPHNTNCVVPLLNSSFNKARENGGVISGGAVAPPM